MAHYFDSRPDKVSPDSFVSVLLQIGELELRLVTAPGVFSRTRIDVGTEVLLQVVDFSGLSGHMLDIGCGYGPISITMAIAAPEAVVWAVDVNDRALDLCRINAERLGLDNLRICRPEEVPDEVQFQLICSNPAIRIGKAKMHKMLSEWLGRLEPDGDAYLVVQRNLGSDSLHRWLSGQGWPTIRVTSVRGYRVLHCLSSSS